MAAANIESLLLMEELRRLDEFLKDSSASIYWEWKGDPSVPTAERSLEQYVRKLVWPKGHEEATTRRQEILTYLGWLR